MKIVILVFQEVIYVPSTIFEIYLVLGLPEEIFTTNQTDSQLWFEQLRRMAQFNLKAKNLEMPTIAIALTASGLLHRPTNRDEGLLFTVPYSNHCSASELAKFLQFLKPRKIERIVQASKSKGRSVISDYIVAIDTQLEPFAGKNVEVIESMDETDEEIIFESRVSKSYVVVMEPEKNMECDDELISSSALAVVKKRNEIQKAEKLLESICTDLDERGDIIIYSNDFSDKLVSLIRLNERL